MQFSLLAAKSKEIAKVITNIALNLKENCWAIKSATNNENFETNTWKYYITNTLSQLYLTNQQGLT